MTDHAKELFDLGVSMMRLQAQQPTDCPRCLGEGELLDSCPRCEGTGRYEYACQWETKIGGDYKEEECPDCSGTGTCCCPKCEGTGEAK